MKRKVSKLLISALLLSATANAVFAKEFNDMSKTHWAYPQIQSLADDRVVVGYPDGSFRPDEAATRAEFSTMVVKALHQENSPLAETFDFIDVPYSYWAYNTIQRAYAFDLVKGMPDGSFKPEDNISKAEAIAIIISAINTGDMTEAQAKEALKGYVDADKIPSWVMVPAGKSEKFNLTAHNPSTFDQFNADKKATRAEIAVNLYNMRKLAESNPNDKLAEAMRPKKGEGIVIENVVVNGRMATIPQGTLLPVKMMTAVNSQKTDVGEVFVANVYKNLVSKDKFILFYEGSNISGETTAVKPARYFIRNAKMCLDTKYIKTPNVPKTEFPANVDTTVPHKKITYIWRVIVKGSKIKFAEGKTAYIKLNHPLTIDLANGAIVK